MATAKRPLSASSAAARRLGRAARRSSRGASAIVSTRDTKKLATEAIRARGRPAATRSSSAGEEGLDDRLVLLHREEQRDVHVDAGGDDARIAGSPAAVPGILIIAFGRATASQILDASAVVASPS